MGIIIQEPNSQPVRFVILQTNKLGLDNLPRQSLPLATGIDLEKTAVGRPLAE